MSKTIDLGKVLPLSAVGGILTVKRKRVVFVCPAATTAQYGNLSTTAAGLMTLAVRTSGEELIIINDKHKVVLKFMLCPVGNKTVIGMINFFIFNVASEVHYPIAVGGISLFDNLEDADIAYRQDPKAAKAMRKVVVPEKSLIDIAIDGCKKLAADNAKCTKDKSANSLAADVSGAIQHGGEKLAENKRNLASKSLNITEQASGLIKMVDRADREIIVVTTPNNAASRVLRSATLCREGVKIYNPVDDKECTWRGIAHLQEVSTALDESTCLWLPIVLRSGSGNTWLTRIDTYRSSFAIKGQILNIFKMASMGVITQWRWATGAEGDKINAAQDTVIVLEAMPRVAVAKPTPIASETEWQELDNFMRVSAKLDASEKKRIPIVLRSSDGTIWLTMVDNYNVAFDSDGQRVNIFKMAETGAIEQWRWPTRNENDKITATLDTVIMLAQPPRVATDKSSQQFIPYDGDFSWHDATKEQPAAGFTFIKVKFSDDSKNTPLIIRLDTFLYTYTSPRQTTSALTAEKYFADKKVISWRYVDETTVVGSNSGYVEFNNEEKDAPVAQKEELRQDFVIAGDEQFAVPVEQKTPENAHKELPPDATIKVPYEIVKDTITALERNGCDSLGMTLMALVVMAEEKLDDWQSLAVDFPLHGRVVEFKDSKYAPSWAAAVSLGSTNYANGKEVSLDTMLTEYPDTVWRYYTGVFKNVTTAKEQQDGD